MSPRFPDAPGRTIPSGTRARIMADSDHVCFYCGFVPAVTLDHVVPWSQDGSHHPMNLVAACGVCNSIAGERLFRDITHKIDYITTRRAVLHASGHDLMGLSRLPDGGGIE